MNLLSHWTVLQNYSFSIHVFICMNVKQQLTVKAFQLSRSIYIYIFFLLICFCLSPAGSIGNKFKWLISWPLLLLLYFTVPNCAKPRWEKYFMFSFLLSTLWIAIFSYFMVWMVSPVFRLKKLHSSTGLLFICVLW